MNKYILLLFVVSYAKIAKQQIFKKENEIVIHTILFNAFSHNMSYVNCSINNGYQEIEIKNNLNPFDSQKFIWVSENNNDISSICFYKINYENYSEILEIFLSYNLEFDMEWYGMSDSDNYDVFIPIDWTKYARFYISDKNTTCLY